MSISGCAVLCMKDKHNPIPSQTASLKFSKKTIPIPFPFFKERQLAFCTFLFQNIADLVAKQQKTKYYQQIKDRKYKRLVKDDGLLDGEKEKQVGYS